MKGICLCVRCMKACDVASLLNWLKDVTPGVLRLLYNSTEISAVVWKCFPTPARTRKLETYGYQELCLSCGESAYLTSYSTLRMDHALRPRAFYSF
jgi:hypothetical protein